MTRRLFTFGIAALIALMATTASAQSTSFDNLTPPAPNKTVRTIADIGSYVPVATALALDFRSAWQGDNRFHDTALFGARVGTVVVAATIAKSLAHRLRPCAPSCGVDAADTSFFSMHTALAFSTLRFPGDVAPGPRIAISLPLAIGTGAGRVIGGKHYLTDVLFGSLVGTIGSRIR